MKRLLTGLAAIALSLAAALLLNRAAPGQWSVGGGTGAPVAAQRLDLWLLQGLAILLMVVALRGGAGSQSAFAIGEQTHSARRRPLSTLQKGGWLSIAAAAGLSFAAAPRFLALEPAPWAWALHGAAVVALAVGGALLALGQRPAAPPATPAHRGRATLVLGALTLVALALRVWRVEAFPFGIWYDEAQNALIARELLATGGRVGGVSWPLYLPVTFHTAHHNYLVAAAFALAGDSIAAARWVSALFGALLVPATWLAARELFQSASGAGQPPDRTTTAVAWLAALLAAGAAWSLNFSRIAVNYNATPLFAVLAVGCLLHGLRTQRALGYLGAGVALGLGLNFYSSFRLFLPVLPLFVVAALMTQRRAGGSLRSAWAASWPGLLLATVAAAVVAGPLIAFGAANPALLLERSSKTFLFAGAAADERWRLLSANILDHLRMFTAVGDPNGRHNLPGRPMLDPMAAALFVPGVALCLWRLREPRHLLLLLWLGFTLLGGILTLAFEAPQSLRANGALPAALLIALVPVAALLRLWEHGPGRVASTSTLSGAASGAKTLWRPAALAAAALLGLSLIWNLRGYAVDQRTDFSVWNAFSAPETLAAQTLATLDPDSVDGWVVVTQANHPTIRYLAPQWSGRQRLLLATDPMPMRWSSGRDSWLFFSDESDAQLDQLRSLYPTATFVENRAPFAEPVTSTHVRLSADDVAQARGLELTYARGSLEDDGWSSPAAVDALPVAWSERAPAPEADWSTGGPIATPFVAQWQGALRTAFGPHTFALEAPARAALFLDESLILQTDGAASGSTVSATVSLADGPHRLRLVAEHGEGPVALRWIPPPENENPFLRIPPDVPVLSEPQRIPAEALIADTGAAVGLLARMAPLSAESAGTPLLDAAASALEGAAAYEVIMPRIDANFHIAPVPPPVAVEWSGTLLAPVDGRYLLAMTATDQARVEVDGAVLLETAAAGLSAEAPITLTAGLHELRVLFGSRGPHVRARFEWVPPGGVRSPVPSLLLHPPYGSTDALAETGRLAAATFAAQQSEFATLQSTGDPLSGELLPELVVAGLSRPTGVAVGNDGRLFVAESGAGAVRIFAADGSDLGAITEGDGPLAEPFDVARMPDGTLLVLDAARAALLLYSSDGAFLRAIPADSTLLDRSRGLDVDGEGRIWIAVTAGGRIVALDGEGTLVREFEAGDSGAQPVDLLALAGVEAGPPPSLYATVLGTNEGVRYDEAGTRMASWALPPANTIDAPHLAAAPGRGIYVTVPEERRIELRAADTTLIASWRLPEALRIKPVALAVDAQGALYVTDTEGGALWRMTPPALP